MADHAKLEYIKDSVEFYEHQVQGVRQLARMKSFLLADEMGLGKSLQALTVAAIDFQMGYADDILVVAPASLKGNWFEEIREHTHFKPLVLDGDPGQRADQMVEYVKDDFNVLIVNYAQLLAHTDHLNGMGFDIVIYDEAHYMKNPRAKRTKACHALEGKRHFLLTGSPMLGHVNDLWSLLYRINQDIENYWRFRHRYCVFGGYKDKQIVGVKNRDELHERLQKFMVRRLKKDWLDLPDKQNIPVYVDLGDLQRKLYDEIAEELRLSAPTASDATPMDIENALTKMIRLKQICGTPAAIEFEEVNDAGEPTGITHAYEDKSPKLDRVVEMAEEIILENGEHLVVFTQSRAVLKALQERFSRAGINWHTLHGDVPTSDRRAVVDRWTNDEPAAMLAMLQVAGVGLTMTKANKCIMVDKLFVPMLMKQAEDRLHRIGADKTQPVQIFEMVTRGTIEQRVEQILKTKKQLFDDVVEVSSVKKALYEALMEEAIDD